MTTYYLIHDSIHVIRRTSNPAAWPNETHHRLMSVDKATYKSYRAGDRLRIDEYLRLADDPPTPDHPYPRQ